MFQQDDEDNDGPLQLRASNRASTKKGAVVPNSRKKRGSGETDDESESEDTENEDFVVGVFGSGKKSNGRSSTTEERLSQLQDALDGAGQGHLL